MRRTKKNNLIILGLCFILLLMGIGYATFSSQFNITGTSNITSTWDVRITNIESELHGAEDIEEPSYDNTNGLYASFSTGLKRPGDYALYTVTIENRGDIDATLTDISISDSNNPAIVFETNGLSEGDNLLKQTEDELIVKVSYSDSITSQPENVTSNITVTLTYEQATGGSTPEEPEEGTAGSDLVEMVGIVTSGDGLYADSYEDNVYTYRGANPNNYVTFNGEQWRIISVNTSDNTIKIMRNAVLSNKRFDSPSGRYSSSGYCNNNSFGCNIYGSSSTLYNSGGTSPITTLSREVGGTAYQLPSKESEISTYLNGTYYNSLNATARSMVKEDAVYKVGVLKNQSGQTTSTDVSQANAANWKGKVGLIDATEYVRASINSSCTGVYYGKNNTGCKNNNWMFNSDAWWTLSPNSGSGSYLVWYVYSSGYVYNDYANYSYSVRPVLTLNSNIQITGGTGTSLSPYTLGV